MNEDAGSDETDDMHDIPLQLPPGVRNYMTPVGARRLAEELRSLSDEQRPKAAAVLAAAEDKAEALRALSRIDRRIAYLSRMKASLEVIEPPVSLERIVFGLVAEVRASDGSESTYRIVGVDESDPERGWISWASPVAKALIGRAVGDQVVVKLPMGESRLKIIGIAYAKEA